MCDKGSGWQSGISSLVRFAAMMPASCAVTSASPFGSSRSRRAVSGAICTAARATARRCESGLPPTSTMRTSPASPRWLSSVIPGAMLVPLPPSRGRDAIQRCELDVEPLVHVVLADVSADRVQAALPFGAVHRECLVDRLRLSLYVEGIHGQRPLAELCMCACVFR